MPPDIPDHPITPLLIKPLLDVYSAATPTRDAKVPFQEEAKEPQSTAENRPGQLSVTQLYCYYVAQSDKGGLWYCLTYRDWFLSVSPLLWVSWPNTSLPCLVRPLKARYHDSKSACTHSSQEVLKRFVSFMVVHISRDVSPPRIGNSILVAAKGLLLFFRGLSWPECQTHRGGPWQPEACSPVLVSGCRDPATSRPGLGICPSARSPHETLMALLLCPLSSRPPLC
jgi:hypothetical protein